MTTQNGRFGASNPEQGTRPFNLAATTSNTLVITRLKRIAESQPTVWEGETPDGQKVHLAYLFGVVSIEVRRPVLTKPGFNTWEPVIRFRPSIMEAELAGRTSTDRQALRSMAERAMVAEIRRSNEADMRHRPNGGHAGNGKGFAETLLNRDRLVIRDSQLRNWLETRNRNLDLLLKRGVAGGTVPVHLDERMG